MPNLIAYTWDEKARQYKGSNGRFVSRQAVRGALDSAIDAAKTDLVATAKQLQDGTINISEWFLRSSQNIKQIQVASGTLAVGGPHALTPSELGYIGSQVKNQLKYLYSLSRELEAGLPLDARFLARVAMYGESGRPTYESILRKADIAAGFAWEKRVLGDSSRACSGCLSEAAMGWQEAGVLTGIGGLACLNLCRCTMIRSRSRPDDASGPGDDAAHVPPPPPPPPPRYGRSSAATTYAAGLDPASAEAFAIRQRAKDVLGLRSAKEAMARLADLVGAPDDATVTARTLGSDMIRARMVGPDYEADRIVYRDDDGSLLIENSSFKVKAGSQGKGIGAAVFGRQVEQAAEFGAKTIVTEAARDREMNGYYTWARFGYDADIPAAVRPDLPPGLRDLARISDLMKTPEGRAAWKEHGISTEMEFDLRDGSLSRRIWDAYRSEKAAVPPPAIPPPAHPPAPGPHP